ncbi:MAG: hypothetical protein ACTSPB_08740 [Candidatus Thorarchaeota archaeon]
MSKIKWETPPVIHLPIIKEYSSENYARIVEDSAGIIHYWIEDGSYDGWAGAPCTDDVTLRSAN